MPAIPLTPIFGRSLNRAYSTNERSYDTKRADYRQHEDGGNRSGFCNRLLWLTFYLTGEPVRLWQLADELSAKGWRNTEGWESAFLYPKVEIVKELAPIVATAEAVYHLCMSHSVEIINIDADTSPDVQQSKFFTLYDS